MLSWLFAPTCPCDPVSKAWIEGRLHWLCAEFDDHVFGFRPKILPTSEFFPDRYDGSEPSVRALLDRVCGYMEVAPDRVELRLVAEAGKLWLVNEAGQWLADAHSAGTFEEVEGKFVICIDKAGLDHPMELVGTIAHELAHARLLGERRVTDDEYDHELLTDLTVTFFGLGIFLANTPRNWDSDYSKWPGTSLNRPEYMTPPMFGYALAHLAWFHGEEKPPWGIYLNWHARQSFKQALRYLFQTGDSTFRPRRFECRA